MKKQLFLIAGAAIILASCGGEEKQDDQARIQAQMDSVANAATMAAEAEAARVADSTLKAMEAEKAAADAAAAAAAQSSGGKKTKTKSAPPASPAPPPPPAPAPGGMRGRSDQTQSGTNGAAQEKAPGAKSGGLRGRSDQTQK